MIWLLIDNEILIHYSPSILQDFRLHTKGPTSANSLLNASMYELSSKSIGKYFHNDKGPAMIDTRGGQETYQLYNQIKDVSLIKLEWLNNKLEQMFVFVPNFTTNNSVLLNTQVANISKVFLNYIMQTTDKELQVYVKDGKIHRDDGPAIISGKYKYWYQHGRELEKTNKEFKDKLNSLIKE